MDSAFFMWVCNLSGSGKAITFRYKLVNKSKLLMKFQLFYNISVNRKKQFFKVEGMEMMTIKRIIIICLITVFPVIMLTACAKNNQPDNNISKNEWADNNMNNDGNESKIKNLFPQELETIPEEYFFSAENAGTLVELNYETYESKTYEQKTQTLQKRAIVYLPYGYRDNVKYNVFYLMHGGWSNETTSLGTPGHPSALKNVIDHGISDGKIQPLIIVCPTYNNLSSSDSADYGLALQLTQNYHNELVNDLIPAVEEKYSTYANSTSKEDLIASRNHRGFGGFSMGSVTTWRTFEYCLDYFRYFLPMSGSFTTDGSYMDNIVKNSGYEWNDFFIVAITGTSDFAASAFEQQIESMKEYTDSFRYSDNEKEGNLTYRIREGYSHDAMASMEYTYNGLCWFWNTETN